MPNPAVEGVKQDGVESPFGSMYDISSFDTFEDCLHVSNQMDSILSYYYSEEGTNTVKIMEIFPLKGEPSAYSGCDALGIRSSPDLRAKGAPFVVARCIGDGQCVAGL